MINWLRNHHFLHDWGRWSETKILYKETSMYEPNIAAAIWNTPEYFYQERYCKTCNKLGFKRSRQ